MDLPDFDSFKASALARGFDEVAERKWDARAEIPEHRHPFSVDALVVQGEMWLTVVGGTRHLEPGDSFQLDREVPHQERYGDAGATYWAARRNTP